MLGKESPTTEVEGERVISDYCIKHSDCCYSCVMCGRFSKKFHPWQFTTGKEGSKTKAKEHGETSTDKPVDGVTDGCPMM
jgi:hypothetical protein